MGGTVWEVLGEVGGNLENLFGARSAPIDIQERLGSLAAAATVSNQDLCALQVEKNGLVSSVSQLESQLAATLEIALELRARLDGQNVSTLPTATATLRGANPAQTPRDVSIVMTGANRPGHLNATTDGLSRGEFSDTIENLRAELKLIKKQTATKGSLSCFPDLLPGVQSLEDVHSWVVANFGGSQEQGGGGDPDSSL